MEQYVRFIQADTNLDTTATYYFVDTSDDDINLTLFGAGGFLGFQFTIDKTAEDNDIVLTPRNGNINGASSYTVTGKTTVTFTSNGKFGDDGDWSITSTTNVEISPDLQIQAGQSITYSDTPYAGTGSFQPIGPDLNLDAAAGSSSDPKYIGVVMGNVLGENLSKTKTYIGAVIGKYSITGTRGSTYPQAGVIAEVGDGVLHADGGFVSVLGGDSALTTANAAYGVDNQNSTPNSGFNYGLDLYKATHDGYPAMEYLVGDIRFSDQSVQTTAYTGPAGVKTYVALLSQTGTDAPVATVLENSLGFVPTYGYTSTGIYTINSTAGWAANKTTLTLGPLKNAGVGAEISSIAQYDYTSSSVLTITTKQQNGSAGGSDVANALLAGTVVEINVYP